MFWDFLNVNKKIWSMKKNKKQKGYDHHSVDPPPHPVWQRSKIQCLFRGEEGDGGEVGPGAASGWGERRRKRETQKKKKIKFKKATQPLHKKNNLATSPKLYRSYCVCSVCRI